jgi:glutamate racemase
VGGLTVVAEIRGRFPSEEVVYFGDTARVPYGNKSPETVRRYSREIARFLLSKQIRILVVACNTSSAVALDELNGHFPVPVLGMIQPGARAAVDASRNGRIGLIGTRATVSSGAYARAVQALDPQASVMAQACPLFVPLVEEGWAEDPVTRDVAQRYLEPLLSAGVDTLILGCTHYPVLIPVLREVAGPRVTLISSATSAVDQLTDLLTPPGGTGSTLRGRLTCYVTDAGTHFRAIGERILGEAIETLLPVAEERLVSP